MDNVNLEIKDDALIEIAKLAVEQNTGARGLRSIMEEILMDTMFELPNEELEKVVVDENAAARQSDPIKVYKTPKKKTSSGS